VDDVEQEIRSRLARAVEEARGRRTLSERAEHGDDETTRRQQAQLAILDADLRYVLAAVEEVAAGLLGADLLPSVLALRAALATDSPERQQVLTHRTTAAWPGFLAGGGSLDVAADGSVTGRLGYVPDGSSATRLVAVLPDGTGAAVHLVDIEGAQRAPLAVLDLTRPAATVDLHAARSWPLGRLPTVELEQVRADWLVAVAADCLGGMSAAFDTAVAYARERKAFGRAIGSFQAVRHRCADMFVDVETTRAVVDGAVTALDEGGEDPLVLALAAASHAMDAFSRVAEAAVLVHGALGFTYECDAHFYLRRAYGNAALLGAVDSLRAELVTL
jgi:hypothetical protein